MNNFSWTVSWEQVTSDVQRGYKEVSFRQNHPAAKMDIVNCRANIRHKIWGEVGDFSVLPLSSTFGVHINPENGSSKLVRTSLTTEFELATLGVDGFKLLIISPDRFQ